MGDHVQGPANRRATLRRHAGEVVELGEKDVDGDTGEKPGHHRVGNKAGVAPELQEPGSDHDPASQRGQQKQRLGALRRVDRCQGRPGRQRRSAGGWSPPSAGCCSSAHRRSAPPGWRTARAPGSPPASTLAAMPSGTPPMATGRPATTSVCNSARSVGRADAHHRLIAAPGAGRRPSLISRPKPLPGHPSPPRPAAASIRRGSTAHRQTCLR
jgi:hypothetical protein